LIVAVAAALLFAWPAFGVDPRVVGIGEQHDGENAEAHVGDTLVITLGANPSLGTWRLATVNQRILRFDSSGWVRARRPPLVGGARGITIFTFKVLARGQTTLKIDYVSKSTARRVLRRFKVRLAVVPPGD
jgi:predicted secreted protein